MARKKQKRDVNTESAGFSTSFGDLLKGALPASALPESTPERDAGGSTAPPTADPATYALGGARLVLRRERKGRAGKTVTRLTGRGDHTLEQPEPALAALARDMRKALGCGATVDAGEIVLQGDIGERAAEWLETKGAVVSR